MAFFVYTIIFAAFGSVPMSLVGAFLLGIIISVWEGDVLGFSSLSFVSTAFAIHLYKRKFNPQAPGFLFLASMVTYSISEMVSSRGTLMSLSRLGYAGITSVCIIGVWFMVRALWDRSDEKTNILR